MNQSYKQLLFNGAEFLLLFGLCATAWILISINSRKDLLALLIAVWAVPALIIGASAFVFLRAERCPQCGQCFGFEIESEEIRRVTGANPEEVIEETIASKRCLSCAYLKQERRRLNTRRTNYV